MGLIWLQSARLSDQGGDRADDGTVPREGGIRLEHDDPPGTRTQAAPLIVLQDEAAVKAGEQQSRRSQLRRAKKLITDGHWDEVD